MSKAARILETVPAQPAAGGSLTQMIERVLLQNPSIETIERLLAMQQTAIAEQKKTSYLADLSKLQAALPAVERKGTGHNQKKYARFEDLVETIKKPMASNRFSLTFRLDQREGMIEVTGVLGHEDGHQEATKLALPADTSGNKNVVQAWGSSISYAKRYVAMTLLGIATEDEDDDGKKAGAPAIEQITEQQVEQLGALIQKTKEPTATAKICLQHFKVASFDQLSTAQFAAIKKQLKEKHGVE